jgi:hypothetical protein
LILVTTDDIPSLVVGRNRMLSAASNCGCGAVLARDWRDALDTGPHGCFVQVVVAPELTMRVHAFALAAVTAAISAAYAQVPGQSAASPAPMTITGCLNASPNPSGVPDTTTYTLEPIQAAAPTAPSPSTGAPPAKTATRYTLTSSAGVAFKPHVGHKVEISGHLKDLNAAKPDAKAAGEPVSKPPAKPGGAHNTFEVTALKMVAAACP